MKKFLCACFMLAAVFAYSQESDDFFSDSNDSVLQKAREKYQQRDGADQQPSDVNLNEKYATEKDDTATVDSDSENGRTAKQDSSDVGKVKRAPPAKADSFDRYRSRRQSLISIFSGSVEIFIGDIFDMFRPMEPPLPEAPAKAVKAPLGEIPYTPVVFSVVPGLSIPFGTYSTNLSCGMIGGLTHDVKGIAASGLFGINLADLVGAQASGIFSISGGSLLGVQGSGVFNIAGEKVTGVQGAGVFNVAGTDILGIQGAGIFNMSRDVTGIQGAGIFNIARNVKGVQAAGIFNIADDVLGAQAAGIVNVAKKVRGTQIGLVNISEDMYGLPIGLVNITINGIRDVGVWYDTSDFMYGYWANGTNNLYSIVYGGEAFDDWTVNSDTLSLGYGVGCRIVGKPLSLDMDLSMKQFFGHNWDAALTRFRQSGPRSGFTLEPVSSFPSLRLSLGMPILKNIEVFGGASADIGISGVCTVPDALKSASAFNFQGFGREINVNPQLFFGVRL